MLAVGAIDMVTGDTWGTLKLLDDHCDFGRGCIQYTRDYDEMTDRSKVRRRYARPPPGDGRIREGGYSEEYAGCLIDQIAGLIAVAARVDGPMLVTASRAAIVWADLMIGLNVSCPIVWADCNARINAFGAPAPSALPVARPACILSAPMQKPPPFGRGFLA
ncbi:hypothetical protein [Burkholderia stabilis]|uniref:hypothetical protein n=1 Tax=Burkholderia stabilis TaxID=95485 RepID=UPI0011464D88|nr:hypothetical protein [Burkholderia stabilis]